MAKPSGANTQQRLTTTWHGPLDLDQAEIAWAEVARCTHDVPSPVKRLLVLRECTSPALNTGP